MDAHDGTYEADELTDSADQLSADQLGAVPEHDSLSDNPAWDDRTTDGSGSSGPDSTGTGGRAGSLTIDFQGQTQTVSATIDLDGNGAPDAAMIDYGHGEAVLVGDTDHDGNADFAIGYQDGRVVSVADQTSPGEWDTTKVGGDSSASSGDSTSTEDSSGNRYVWVDTDGDGVADHAGSDSAGTTYLVDPRTGSWTTT